MTQPTYLLGLDIGSSSIKASIIDAETGALLATAFAPEREMPIDAPKAGWAEQDPEMWWRYSQEAIKKVQAIANPAPDSIKAIGISYQMHGLVMVDEHQEVLRPSIIWCDSRAVGIGNEAFESLGSEFCLCNFLNSPGNFTASKLKWVRDNQPDIYSRIHKVMLPGDYIAMKLTGQIMTSITGLSEGIFWNYQNKGVAQELLDHYGIDKALLPEAVPSFSFQGNVTAEAAQLLGLSTAAAVTYRAGDQPNNAFSLNVLQPGEVAATAGTSGAVYGIFDNAAYDAQSRVNTFIHVNHTQENEKSGVLLCVNGTGILNSWLRKEVANMSYEEMNNVAAKAPIGSKGLQFFPFGNGAERILGNENMGARLQNLDFLQHGLPEVLRSGQEGIVFALRYGISIMQDMGMRLSTIKAGYANMFLSPLFAEAFANTTGVTLELYNTDGSQGAARGAGVGAGIYASEKEAFQGLKKIKEIAPDPELTAAYQEAYTYWLAQLQKQL